MPTDDNLNAGASEETTDAGTTDTTGAEGTQAGAQGAAVASSEMGKTSEADAGNKAAGDKAAGEKAAGQKPGAKTILAGADTEEEEKAADEKAAADKAAKPDPNALTDDLKKLLAEHYAAGDKKAFAQELRRLDRVKDLKSLWGMYREMEGKFTSGGLIKVPGKDAKPEEVAAFHKALGVPEKPEDYLKDVTLENGAVIGAADKPMLEGFAGAMHKAGAPPAVVNAALNWYYQNQEQAAAALDEGDDTFRKESERALKDEFGPSFKRQVNAVSTLFATAPGGADPKNPGSLYSRLIGGRTADGRIIGNDPEIMRWLISMANEVNPVASVVEDGAGGLRSAEARLDELKALRRSDPKKYWSDAVQKEEVDLIEAIAKTKARAA